MSEPVWCVCVVRSEVLEWSPVRASILSVLTVDNVLSAFLFQVCVHVSSLNVSSVAVCALQRQMSALSEVCFDIFFENAFCVAMLAIESQIWTLGCDMILELFSFDS